MENNNVMCCSKEMILRIFLGTLLTLVAINAFGGGFYGMMGAEDVPPEWLEGSPFSSYFLPSFFLFLVVGGSCLFGAVAVFRNAVYARKASYFCGVLMLLWITVQVIIIGYVSWLQPAVFVAGLLTVGLTYLWGRYNRLYTSRD